MVEVWMNVFGEIVETWGLKGEAYFRYRVRIMWNDAFKGFWYFSSRRAFLKNLKERGWEKLQ